MFCLRNNTQAPILFSICYVSDHLFSRYTEVFLLENRSQVENAHANFQQFHFLRFVLDSNAFGTKSGREKIFNLLPLSSFLFMEYDVVDC